MYKPILTLLLLLSSPLALSHPPVLNIEKWTTQNGAQVLFVEAHELPMVDIQITFDAGSSRDDTYPGIAHFTSAMLDEGTNTLTANKIADIFDSLGAQFGTGINKDMATIHLRSLTNPNQLNPAIKTFTDILTHPAFPLSEFKRVQKQILMAIKEEEQYPNVIASKIFYQTLYGHHPYGHPTIGSQKIISLLTPKDLKSFYQKHYLSNNAVIAIVGDLSKSQAKTITDRIMAKLPQGQQPDELPQANPSTHTLTQNRTFPSQQTHVFMGQIGINWQSTDYFPLLVGNYMLGASPLTAILFEEIRNKRGLAYHVGSAFQILKAKGPFIITLQTKTKQTKQAITVTQQALKQFMTEGPSKQQLNDAKKSLIGKFPLQIASNSQILHYLTLIGFYHLPLDYLETYREKINAVTKEQIQEALNRHIQLNKLAIITVGKNRKTSYEAVIPA